MIQKSNPSANADLNSLSVTIKPRQVTIIEPEMIKKYKFTKSKKTECNKHSPYSFIKVAVLATLVSGTVLYIWKK